MSGFRLAAESRCRLGESPVWSNADRRLLFVDIDGARLHRFDPETGALERCALDEPFACVAPMRGGGLVGAARSGLWRLEADGTKRARLADNPEDPALSRFNDGKVDPAGRLVIGCMDERKTGFGAGLYRFDRRGLVRLAGGLLTSNGLAWSNDGRTLYHADTPRFTVWVWDYDPETGEIADRRVFAQLDPDAPDRARPDGAAVDRYGCYWSALYDGARVHRYDPDGRLMSVHPVPTRRPTMPAFVGPDDPRLFLTSAADPDGAGGDLYALEAETGGTPPPPFDPGV